MGTSMYGKRIVIADPDEKFRRELKRILNAAGAIMVGDAGDGLTALRITRTTQPDLVIINAQLPVMDGLELAKTIEESRIAPVILLTEITEKDFVHRTTESWIFGYLIKPVTKETLFGAIQSALANFQRLTKLERELAKLKDTLATRKIVDKAKGILMETLKITEEQAFRRIQKQSMDKGIPMRSIAEAIILANDVGL